MSKKLINTFFFSIIALNAPRSFAACSTGSISAVIFSGLSIEDSLDSLGKRDDFSLFDFNSINLFENDSLTSLLIRDLAFGKINPGSGGKVVISSAGVRSSNGGVQLVSGGSHYQGLFQVMGLAGATYSIVLPADQMTLSSGANTLSAHTFVSNPASIGVLDATGTQVINVGASLSVANGQNPGVYTGTYTVCAEYN